MKRVYSLLYIVFLSLAYGCTEESDDQSEKENFSRIYDVSTFSDSFHPVDVIQDDNGGYIVLAARRKSGDQFNGIYILKTDAAGNFEKEYVLGEEYMHPLQGLFKKDNKIYFVCMTDAAQAHLIEVDAASDEINPLPLQLLYPSAAAFVDNELLVLGYDPEEQNTVFAKVTTTGTVSRRVNFKISDDDSFSHQITEHFFNGTRHFPFAIGKVNTGSYYFNGFFDYSFSLVFSNLGDDDDADGVIMGQHDEGGFNAILPLNGNRFAASYFNFGSNFILPNTPFEINGITSIDNIEGNNLREIRPDTPVQILKATAAGKNVIIYTSTTISKQIGLFFYDESGEFLGSKYAGFANPYECGRVLQTSDGGIVIAGTTYIAGRFPRICLIKFSKDELSSAVQ